MKFMEIHWQEFGLQQVSRKLQTKFLSAKNCGHSALIDLQSMGHLIPDFDF